MSEAIEPQVYQFDSLEDYAFFKGKTFPDRGITNMFGQHIDGIRGWADSFYYSELKTGFVVFKYLDRAHVTVHAATKEDADHTFEGLVKLVQELKAAAVSD